MQNIPAQPGTSSHAVIAYLRGLSEGAEASTTEICKATPRACPSNSLTMKLQKSVRAGLILRRRADDGRSWLYSLPVQTADRDAPVQVVVSAATAPPVHTWGVRSVFDLAQRLAP